MNNITTHYIPCLPKSKITIWPTKMFVILLVQKVEESNDVSLCINIKRSCCKGLHCVPGV